MKIVDSKTKPPVVGKVSTITQPIQPRTNGTKPPKYTNYEIAMHTVRLQQSGTMISVDLTWNLSCNSHVHFYLSNTTVQ